MRPLTDFGNEYTFYKDAVTGNIPLPVIHKPKPLGNESAGKRKSGKSRYEPPKFG